MIKNKPKILIVGATASGKSALAFEVAKKLNTDIISCDSMQVYRKMDIGTAKPSIEEQSVIKHHMIDIVNIDDDFSAAKFSNKVNELLSSYEKIPLLAGGTGLYFNSLLFSYNFADTIGSEAVRFEIDNMYNNHGKEYLYKKLQSIDPMSASQVHMNNITRVKRALEIYMITGIPKSQQVKNQQIESDYLAFDIDIDRQKLYEKINQRVDTMLKLGLIDEVEGIIKLGYEKSLPSLRAIGYKEIIEYLCGALTKSDAIELLKQNTRNYAKRQLTWFRKFPNVIHLNGTTSKMSELVVETYKALYYA